MLLLLVFAGGGAVVLYILFVRRGGSQRAVGNRGPRQQRHKNGSSHELSPRTNGTSTASSLSLVRGKVAPEGGSNGVRVVGDVQIHRNGRKATARHERRVQAGKAPLMFEDDDVDDDGGGDDRWAELTSLGGGTSLDEALATTKPEEPPPSKEPVLLLEPEPLLI